MHSARILLALAVLIAAPLAHAQREKLSLADLKIVEEKWPTAKKTVTGLRYVVQTAGEGETAKTGDLVSFIYRGALLDGTVFDEDWNRLKPLPIRIGRSLVIAGMDEGLKLMKKGTHLTLIIPSLLAYGSRGDPPKIAPNATLVFEIEVIEIERNPSAVAPPPATGKKK